MPGCSGNKNCIMKTLFHPLAKITGYDLMAGIILAIIAIEFIFIVSHLTGITK